MNEHDVNRIENALFILLQYKDNDKFKDIISEVFRFDNILKNIMKDEFFNILEDIKTYF